MVAPDVTPPEPASSSTPTAAFAETPAPAPGPPAAPAVVPAVAAAPAAVTIPLVTPVQQPSRQRAAKHGRSEDATAVENSTDAKRKYEVPEGSRVIQQQTTVGVANVRVMATKALRNAEKIPEIEERHTSHRERMDDKLMKVVNGAREDAHYYRRHNIPTFEEALATQAADYKRVYDGNVEIAKRWYDLAYPVDDGTETARSLWFKSDQAKNVTKWEQMPDPHLKTIETAMSLLPEEYYVKQGRSKPDLLDWAQRTALGSGKGGSGVESGGGDEEDYEEEGADYDMDAPAMDGPLPPPPSRPSVAPRNLMWPQGTVTPAPLPSRVTFTPGTDVRRPRGRPRKYVLASSTAGAGAPAAAPKSVPPPSKAAPKTPLELLLR